MPEGHAFRRGPIRVAADLAVLACGLALVVFALVSAPYGRWVWLVSGGAVALGALNDVVRPLYVVNQEGILLARSGGGGYPAYRPAVLIRWTSVRDVQRFGEDRISLGLLDGRWMTLPIGSLSRNERRRFIDTIKCSASLVGKEADYGHWE